MRCEGQSRARLSPVFEVRINGGHGASLRGKSQLFEGVSQESNVVGCNFPKRFIEHRIDAQKIMKIRATRCVAFLVEPSVGVLIHNHEVARL